jgi:hypothetical protein
MSEAINNIGSWAEKEGQKRGVLDDFLYLNYANGRQRVYERSVTVPDLERMRQIQRMYDPSGIFDKLWKGGFKVSKKHDEGQTERDDLKS